MKERGRKDPYCSLRLRVLEALNPKPQTLNPKGFMKGLRDHGLGLEGL